LNTFGRAFGFGADDKDGDDERALSSHLLAKLAMHMNTGVFLGLERSQSIATASHGNVERLKSLAFVAST